MSAELATPQTGARKERATQPKTGTRVPILKPKPQRVRIVSDRNEQYELKLFVDIKNHIREIKLDVSSFNLIPQNEIELIMMNRLSNQVDLQSPEVQNSYPVIDLNKILSIFYYEQEKMWKYSILKEMYEKQKFAVFYIKDDNGSLLIARFLVSGATGLILSIHHPDQVPFLFEGGYIGTKLQFDTLEPKLLQFETEKESGIVENIFLFIKDLMLN